MSTLKALGLIFIIAALTLVLGFSLRTPGPKAMAERATVYLADRFHGCTVTVKVDDELVFYGNVFSNDAIQHAATIPLHVRTSPFMLRIRADHLGSRTDAIILEQKIDCAKGPYICVFLRGDKLLLTQESHEPEFY